MTTTLPGAGGAACCWRKLRPLTDIRNRLQRFRDLLVTCPFVRPCGVPHVHRHPRALLLSLLRTGRSVHDHGPLSAGTTVPAPRRVIGVDLDAPLPRLVADRTGSSAMVIGYRDGHPTGTLDVLLTDDPDDATRALHALQETVLADVPSVPDDALPTISVVVSTVVDRVEDLGRLLDVLERLDYPRHEVILVDNRVSLPDIDALPALLEGRDVRLVTERRPGLSAGRNAGVAAARGDVVAFTDDDVRVDPRWLRAIGSRFVREPGLDAVTGVILPSELATPAQIWYEAYYGGFSAERTFAPVTIVPTTSRHDASRPRLRRHAVGRGPQALRRVRHRRVRRRREHGVPSFAHRECRRLRHHARCRVPGPWR
ncbi:glycosyltransferase family A protein [Curtobacterium flaccumfaciens]|nr:glycosyltransferase family A protein [Curtobacterium flaccumfaciens]